MAIKTHNISIPPRIRRREKEQKKYIIQKRLKWAVAIVVCIAFIWYILSDDLGIIAMARLKIKEKKLRQELVRLKFESDSLENVIYKLENDTLFIEQMARKKLGMTKNNEKMFIFRTYENK